MLPADDVNPYQRKLSEALRARQIETTTVPYCWRIDRLIAKYRPDVLHFHWLHYWVVRTAGLRFFVGLWYLKYVLARFRRRGGRVVWTVHNIVNHERIRQDRDRKLSSWMAHRADVVIVHSKEARDAVVATYGLTDAHCVVIPHGSFIGYYPDTISADEARAKLGLSPGVPMFLCFGLVRRYKGFDVLERALEDPSLACEVVIAGPVSDAGLRADLEAWAARDARVHLQFGRVPDEDVQVYFRAADAVLFMHVETATSGAALLAKSFGRACIAPSTVAFRSILSADANFLYASGEPAALAEALAGAIRAGRAQLVAQGRHNYEEALRCTWESVAEMTASAYGWAPTPAEPPPHSPGQTATGQVV